MIDITYDRSQRVYTWIEPESGEVLTAPAGAAGKAQLFQAAIALLEPDLCAAAARWVNEEPALERVIWRAAELVANGGVEVFPGDGRLLAKVQSSDEYGRYTVSNLDGYIVCECPSFDSFQYVDGQGAVWCKHKAAARLFSITRQDNF